jgi:hypothetical protein
VQDELVQKKTVENHFTSFVWFADPPSLLTPMMSIVSPFSLGVLLRKYLEREEGGLNKNLIGAKTRIYIISGNLISPSTQPTRFPSRFTSGSVL